jgi:hypothetical protein
MSQKAALSQLYLERVSALCFELGDPAHRQQAVGKCSQCRNIIGQHGCADAEAQCKYTGDAGEVGPENHQPAVADIAVEVAGDVAQLALCSMNTTCAVSVAIEVAPRSETETLSRPSASKRFWI